MLRKNLRFNIVKICFYVCMCLLSVSIHFVRSLSQSRKLWTFSVERKTYFLKICLPALFVSDPIVISFHRNVINCNKSQRPKRNRCLDDLQVWSHYVIVSNFRHAVNKKMRSVVLKIVWFLAQHKLRVDKQRTRSAFSCQKWWTINGSVLWIAIHFINLIGPGVNPINKSYWQRHLRS